MAVAAHRPARREAGRGGRRRARRHAGARSRRDRRDDRGDPVRPDERPGAGPGAVRWPPELEPWIEVAPLIVLAIVTVLLSWVYAPMFRGELAGDDNTFHFAEVV